jgi:hypothetical protein
LAPTANLTGQSFKEGTPTTRISHVNSDPYQNSRRFSIYTGNSAPEEFYRKNKTWQQKKKRVLGIYSGNSPPENFQAF